MTSINNIHHWFTGKFEDYQRSDIKRISKFILTKMNIPFKGDGIDALKDNWSKVCNWLVNSWGV